MAILLHIDSALDEARLSIADSDQILAELTHCEQKSHASFLQSGITDILRKTGRQLSEIDGVSVSAGPGSYTGLRVGLASAKGICYTLNKPLILLNTLEIMAEKIILDKSDLQNNLYAPMIDARRMEVFTALYNEHLMPLLEPGAYLLDGKNFALPFQQQDRQICFFGSGMEKWRNICPEGNYAFLSLPEGSAAQNRLAQQYYKEKRFADVAYSEPLYFKSFYTTAKIQEAD